MGWYEDDGDELDGFEPWQPDVGDVFAFPFVWMAGQEELKYRPTLMLERGPKYCLLAGLTNPRNFKSAGLPPVRMRWTTALQAPMESWVKRDRVCVNLVPLERIPLVGEHGDPTYLGCVAGEEEYQYVRRHVLGALANGTVGGLEGYQWVGQGHYAPVRMCHDKAASKLMISHQRDKPYARGRV